MKVKTFSHRFYGVMIGVCSMVLAACTKHQGSLPQGFVSLQDLDPTIIQSVRYAGSDNFLGRPVVGYTTAQIVCTRQAAERLKAVQEKVRSLGYSLVVYDAYRPQRAVNDFKAWSENMNDQLAKDHYYPTLDKRHLFDLGYIAQRSGHSRGSTVDLTLIPLGQSVHETQVSWRTLPNGDKIPFLDDGTVDMGASFDLFHEVSHHDSPLLTDPQHRAMRHLLRLAMMEQGFKSYSKEWWHYTLADEPFPDTYFDFVVEASGK